MLVRRVAAVVVLAELEVEVGLEAWVGEVGGKEESEETKEKTWSSRRSQRRARVWRCGVEENWVGVGAGR